MCCTALLGLAQIGTRSGGQRVSGASGIVMSVVGSRREIDLEPENAGLGAQNVLLREQVATLRTEMEELEPRLGEPRVHQT